MPSISVGLPVYNGEKYLEDTLEALLSQTFEDFELVISDNASTDRTADICRKYAVRDKRIRYFRNPVLVGVAQNFRRVYELSTAAYFKWAGVDDVCAREYLEKCKAVLDEHPEAVLCCTKVNIIDGSGNIIRRYEDSQALLQPKALDRFRQFFCQDSWCNVLYGLLRSRTLKKTPLMKNFPGADIVLFAELALHGQFIEIPEYLFFRRIHPEALSYEPTFERLGEIFNPGKGNKEYAGLLTTWRHLYEHLRSIQTAPVKFTEKLFLTNHVLRMARWKRHALLQELFAATRRVAQAPPKG